MEIKKWHNWLQKIIKLHNWLNNVPQNGFLNYFDDGRCQEKNL